MKKFAVFGNPIEQSISPLIHADFAKQAKIAIQYEKRLTTEACFAQDVVDFFNLPSAVGCNITAPFKELAYELAQSHDDSATLAGAVNTLFFNKQGVLAGANTDGVGLVMDIKRTIGSLENLHIMLLGAGGAARGVIFPLLAAGVASITVGNRTHHKAQKLVMQVNDSRVFARTLNKCNDCYDVIINSTSAELSNRLPEMGAITFTSAKLTYDMVYKKLPTNFLLHAQSQGSKKICDGLGMLIGQAAQSFQIWTGFQPTTETLLHQLRANLTK